ncbi:MAG: hypothetical protein JNL97_01080 [Verrucomicrobiales bacterium]|nr:hypothetical protein [Verrucomicrobiales bacterium]
MTRKFPIRWFLPAVLAVTLIVWIGDLRAVLGGRAGGTRPGTDSELPRIPSVETFPVHTSRVVSSAREWMQSQQTAPGLRRRDPFLYGEDARESRVVAAPSTPPPPLPSLRGISLGAGAALAVLDRTVVGEGDSMGPWKVERIARDVVWLDGPGGRQSIRVTRDASHASPPRGTDPRSPSLARTNAAAPSR